MAWFDLGLGQIFEEMLDRRAIRKIERLKQRCAELEKVLEAARRELKATTEELRAARVEISRLARELGEARARIETLRLVAESRIAGVAEVEPGP